MLISKRGVSFLAFIFGLPLLIFGVYFIFQGFSDYLLLSLMFIMGLLLVIGGSMTYKDSFTWKLVLFLSQSEFTNTRFNKETDVLEMVD